MQDKKITMFQGGIIFTVSVVLFILFSFINQLFDPFGSFYIAGVVGEVLPILLPSVIGILIFKKSLKHSLKLNRLRLLDGVLILFITLLSMPLTMAVNAFNMWLVKVIFGQNVLVDIPIPETGTELLISLLVIGVVAAVCEEVLFRGVLQTSFGRLGKTAMFLLVSLLFAAFHFSIEQFLGIFVLSLLITYVVYRTNSIFAGMLAHFVNNATAMLISYYINKIPENILTGGESSMEIPMLLQVIVIGVIVLLFASIGAVLIYVLHRRTRETHTIIPPAPQLRARDIVSFLPGIIIMGAMFLFTIVSYIFLNLTNF